MDEGYAESRGGAPSSYGAPRAFFVRRALRGFGKTAARMQDRPTTRELVEAAREGAVIEL